MKLIKAPDEFLEKQVKKFDFNTFSSLGKFFSTKKVDLFLIPYLSLLLKENIQTF